MSNIFKDLKEFIDNHCEETAVIDMSAYIREEQDIQVNILLKSARTMCMMYQVTGERPYLAKAKLDIIKAKSIKERGFVRPVGCYLAA